MRRSTRARVAQMLIAAMREQGVNQHQLADLSGVSQPTISGLVNQKRSLSKQARVRTNRTLRALASALGKQPTYFEQASHRTPQTLGQAVQQARLSMGLSLQQLDALVKIPYSTLSLLERDKWPEERVQARWRIELTRVLELDEQFAVDVLSDGDTPTEKEYAHG